MVKVKPINKVRGLKNVAVCCCLSLLFSPCAKACISCNRLVREGIYGNQFRIHIIQLLAGFAVIILLLIIINKVWRIRERSKQLLLATTKNVLLAPLGMAGLVLGVGLGGFIDGILFHQILQWHEMFSAQIAATDYVGKSINMFWDGIFHSLCLITVVAGVVLLWRLPVHQAVNRSGRLLTGGLLMGWAIFNILEGLLNHLWLNLHHVYEYAQHKNQYDFAFLGGSAVVFLLGLWTIRTTKQPGQGQVIRGK